MTNIAGKVTTVFNVYQALPYPAKVVIDGHYYEVVPGVNVTNITGHNVVANVNGCNEITHIEITA